MDYKYKKSKRIKKAIVSLSFVAFFMTSTAFAIDTENLSPSSVVGTIGITLKHTDTFVEECSLGSATADAVRDVAATDIAMINSGDMFRNIPVGECTWSDVANAFKEDRALVKASVTVEQLFDILEISVSHQILDNDFHIDVTASSFDGFLQISGFTFQYDMSAHAGERIYYVCLDDGTELTIDDSETIVTLAAPEFMLRGGYGYPELSGDSLDMTMEQALVQYIASGKVTSSYESDGRIVALGTADSTIVNQYPVIVTISVLLVILIVFGMTNQRVRRIYDEVILRRTYGEENCEKQ